MKKLVPIKARNGLTSIFHLRSSFADSIWEWNELLFGFSFEPYSCDFVDRAVFTRRAIHEATRNGISPTKNDAGLAALRLLINSFTISPP